MKIAVLIKSYALISLAILFWSSCGSLPSYTQADSLKKEYVVLLHGLARSDGSMKRMQEALIEQGYGTCNIDYPSRKHSIETLAHEHVLPEILRLLPGKNVKISFVAHSLGGIIVRELLRKHRFENLNAVVMLSPPNQGSEVVDAMGDWWLFEWINGPAGKELGTDEDSMPNKLGAPDYKLGIITGNATINPILSLMIPGEDDGKVSVESARLEGMSDFLVVPVSHPFIMKDEEVIRQVLHFLEFHHFLCGDSDD